ncbi:hypothetical protein ACFL0T_05925 [Candidatus Omnitrophota bacterium]
MKKIVVFLFFLIFIICRCLPLEGEETLKTTIKDIVSLSWELDLLQIERIYIGGKVHRRGADEKIASYYEVKAKLKDLNLPVKLRFHQKEEYIGKQYNKYNTDFFVLKQIIIDSPSDEFINTKFSEISMHIRHVYPKSYREVPESKDKASYYLRGFDKIGGVRIDITKQRLGHTNSLRVMITHTVSVVE